MSAFMRSFRGRRARREPVAPDGPVIPAHGAVPEVAPVEIAPNDPIIPFFQSAAGVVDIDDVTLDSPGLEALREAGVKTVVPLVSQGELIGLLNLGPRLSEQEYSADDRKLLENLAGQAAPAVRLAQLVRQQEAEARSRERLEQELRVAQLIQQNFLPKQLPDRAGWQVAAYYQPARAVGGDFYDFIELPSGELGLVVGDVTDKGVPAALVMAATRSVLRASAQRLVSPGEVLERVNELLTPDMPPNMFVTCLYGVLDTGTGRLRYANAGHNVPYVRTETGVVELRARGMPLGLMPGMAYEEKEAYIDPGYTVLLHSDGLVEAHSPERDMFGFPRMVKLMQDHPGGSGLIDRLLSELDAFTGPAWEQEDDVTLVAVQRSPDAGVGGATAAARTVQTEVGATADRRTITQFEVPSQQGNERVVMERVAEAVREIGLSPGRLEQLKTAVSEATMNAIEHGNQNRPELPVSVKVVATETALSALITDRGGGQSIPDPELPDIEAKLAGEQSPRGWGLFLIKNMVDDMRIHTDERHHTVELILHLKGDDHGDE